jgi:hypothetical protein
LPSEINPPGQIGIVKAGRIDQKLLCVGEGSIEPGYRGPGFGPGELERP